MKNNQSFTSRFLGDIDRLRKLKKNSLDGSQSYSDVHLFHRDDLSFSEVLQSQKVDKCEIEKISDGHWK